MKNTIKCFALCVACLGALTGNAQTAAERPRALSQGSGSINGRVLNVVTGKYLNNARVSVVGTDIVTFTNEVGAYHLANVPSGAVVVEVAYTGLDADRLSLDLTPGGSLTRDFELSNQGRYGAKEDVLKLEKFVVAQSREMEGQAVAINEQRYAGNLKNVLSSDTHGDVTQGSVAEFMKYMPGVTANYGDANADTLSVRGLADNMTGVTFDGAPMANSSYANTRSFHFTQISINTISRLELTKVPTPSTPADSVGGSINLVSKSAFERSRPEFSYRTFVSMNSHDFNIRPTQFPYEENNYKAIPGFELSYSNPVSDKFGYVFTAGANGQYNPQDYSTNTWRGVATTGAPSVTPTNPYLASYTLIDAPKRVFRTSTGLKLDWKLTEHSTLSLGLQANYHRDDNANFTWGASAGTVGTPTGAGSTPLTYSPTQTSGASGRGSVTMAGGHHHYAGPLLAQNLRYRFENGDWRIDAGVSNSDSKSTFRYGSYGHFQRLNISLKENARVVFSDINADQPGSIRAFADDGHEIDLFDINSYKITGAQDTIRDVYDNIKSADFNVRRELRSLPFSTAIQVGGSVRNQERDSRQPTIVYDYAGINGDFSAAPYASQIYSSSASPFGFRPPWASPAIAYEAWQKNPGLFTMNEARLVSNQTSRITTSEYVDETISALYLQGEVRLFNNRLKILGGVRHERTQTEGRGPLVDPSKVWALNPDGTFARDVNGNRIRKAEAGAVGSMQQLSLTHTERGYRTQRAYDDFYPSLHLTYNITDNFLARFAWAQTYGRPNFSEIIPNTVISWNELDPDMDNSVGTITLRNTALKPWAADNYDFSLEYYTKQGGVFSAGAFVKDITDFFGASSRIASAADIELLGLDPRFVGWTVNTKFNSGDARITGVEFNVSQSLAPLGNWGKQFQVFANGTKLDLSGGQEADWRGYVPENLNWGITYSRNPIIIKAKWQYRGETQDSPDANGSAGTAFTRTAARTLLDLNVDYQLSDRISLFANARNVFNVRYRALAYGPDTPDYATQRNTRNYGIQYAFGLRGSF